MSLQHFKTAFGGHEAITLCQSLAVANGNQSLHDTTLSQSEAKRYIATWQGDLSLFSSPQWTLLAEEIYQLLDECKENPHKIKREVCKILMHFRKVAPYFFHINNENTNQVNINGYFRCIIKTFHEAQRTLHAIGHSIGITSGEFDSKWNKPIFQAIAQIGIALETLANIIQGCLYEHGIKTSLFEYQKACGIALTSEITPESLAQSMDWTIEMAKDYMNISSEEDKKIVPLSTIPELKKAMEDGVIDSDGNVQCSDRQLVMYFYEHRMFLPLNKKDFRRIDRLLTSQRKTTIHCGDLSKVAQQLRKDDLIEDHIRYQGKHIKKYS